jgi:hypothetical protein
MYDVPPSEFSPLRNSLFGTSWTRHFAVVFSSGLYVKVIWPCANDPLLYRTERTVP